MNILVCVKQVPKDEDLKLDPVTKTLIRSGATGVISEYDKYAMEMAARLKESCGGTVTAITMGPPASAEVLRYCLSVGADQVCLLSDRKMGGADAYATVNTLVAAIKHLGSEPYDLILCGKQASDSDTSLVMPQLAEALGCAQATFVYDYEMKDNSLHVTRETDDGYDILALPFPAVISVGKTVFAARRPNMRLKLKANHTEIPTLDADAMALDSSAIGVPGSLTTVGDSYFPEHSKTCVRISGDSNDEIAKNLIDTLHNAKLI